jgi:hypothetical protein
MKRLLFVIMLALPACGPLKSPKTEIAQCQLLAASPTGEKFQQDTFKKLGFEGLADEQLKAASATTYSHFMLTCMSAKGYDIRSYADSSEGLRRLCSDGYATGVKGVISVDREACYVRRWIS